MLDMLYECCRFFKIIYRTPRFVADFYRWVTYMMVFLYTCSTIWYYTLLKTLSCCVAAILYITVYRDVHMFCNIDEDWIYQYIQYFVFYSCRAFYLSLNKKDKLGEESQTLEDLGLVSGDLLYIVSDEPEIEGVHGT